jgi:tetratricopeptide (TPR) repeat protein
MLVLLDNAASADQVRPLLPGTDECLVVVTSRSSLSGMVSRNGASRLFLEAMSPLEAYALLRNVAGADRVDVNPGAAEELARCCARLPLALRIAAERATADDQTSLTNLVAELADERHRLDLLASDDTATATRAVFSWSYRRLEPEPARVFRLLGLHPGPDFAVHVVAALANVPLHVAKRHLQVLKDAHLVQADGRGRYRLHDLLRVYATELAQAEERHREAAARRMLVWYLRTTDAADRLLLPHHPTMPLGLADLNTVPAPFVSRVDALTWCREELANLVAAIRFAAQAGEHWIAARFPRALWSYFDLRKPWSDWITTYKIGLSSAQQLGDRGLEGWITSALGAPHTDLERFDEAAAYFSKAVEIRRNIGDLQGLAGSLTNLGNAYRHLTRFDEALACYREALSLRRSTNDPRGEAVTLNRLGGAYRDLGRLDESLDCLQRSLAIRQRIGDRHGEGFALGSLGGTLEELGRLPDAIDAYRSSLAAHRDVGAKRGEAESLLCQGKVTARIGKVDEARELLRQALEIFKDLGSRRVVEVVEQLVQLGDARR